MMKIEFVDKSGAAIVCPYVTKKELPIMYAYKGEPIDPADSGWQFLSEKEVDANDLKIWSINEVLEYEPSLREYIELPVGTELIRNSVNTNWKVFNE